MTGALFGAYPVTGGFSRTAVNDKAGARTPLASIITFCIVALVIWKFTPVLYHLPKSTLASMIMGAVFGLLDVKLPLHLFRENKIDAVMWLSTFVITLTLGLQTGILTGVIMSFTTHIFNRFTANKSASNQPKSIKTREI